MSVFSIRNGYCDLKHIAHGIRISTIVNTRSLLHVLHTLALVCTHLRMQTRGTALPDQSEA